jgi:hypothetical protein
VTISPNTAGDLRLRQAIALNHDDTSATLAFTPCLVKLLDDVHCQMVSAMLKEVGSEWEIRVAQPDL